MESRARPSRRSTAWTVESARSRRSAICQPVLRFRRRATIRRTRARGRALDPVRRRRAILQTLETVLAVATQPLVAGADAHAEGLGDLFGLLAGQKPLDEIESTPGGRLRVTMELHPGSLLWGLVGLLQPHSLRGPGCSFRCLFEAAEQRGRTSQLGGLTRKLRLHRVAQLLIRRHQERISESASADRGRVDRIADRETSELCQPGSCLLRSRRERRGLSRQPRRGFSPP